jgi:hypothetical protein
VVPHSACFCDADETILHLFFNCPLARYIWSLFQCAFNSPVQPMDCIELGGWVDKFAGAEKLLLRLS